MTALVWFWFGGMVACVGQVANELQGGVPENLREHFATRAQQVRACAFLLALLLLWPAGLALLYRQRRDHLRNEAEEQAEFERIEATRVSVPAPHVKGEVCWCGHFAYQHTLVTTSRCLQCRCDLFIPSVRAPDSPEP